jgi:hypothetical protein
MAHSTSVIDPRVRADLDRVVGLMAEFVASVPEAGGRAADMPKAGVWLRAALRVLRDTRMAIDCAEPQADEKYARIARNVHVLLFARRPDGLPQTIIPERLREALHALFEKKRALSDKDRRGQ